MGRLISFSDRVFQHLHGCADLWFIKIKVLESNFVAFDATASDAYNCATSESTVRTTLDIDDDVLEAAKILARQSDRTAGAVLSELARRALTSSPPTPTSVGVGGFVPFESRGGLVTNEQIDRLREQDAY